MKNFDQRIASYLFFILLLFSFQNMKLQAQTNELSVDNGTLHLKVDLVRGGAINYLSESGSTRNLVNIHDEGRYIQQSYYAGNPINRQSEGQSSSWSPWPWNPIQAGDAFGNRAQILDSSVDGNTIYVKCIPMHWDMNNKPAEATFEQWTTLEGNVLKVHNKMTCFRTDTIYGATTYRNQEFPAVYPISSLSKLHSYFGDTPFTNDTMVTPSVVNLSSGFWGRYMDVTENWMAFTDNNDWGMGVYCPGSIEQLAGMAGSAGGEATSSGTSYLSPLKDVGLEKNDVLEYDYYIIIGDVTTIRSKVYDLRVEQDLNWDFDNGDDDWNIRPNNCTISSSNGNLVVNVTGTDPHIKNTTLPQFYTANPTHLQIRVKNETSATAGQLITYPISGGSFALDFTMTPNSTTFEDISIDLSTVSGWSAIDYIRDIRLDPVNGGTGTVTFDYIRFFVPLISLDISGASSVEMGTTEAFSADLVPGNATNNAVTYSVDNTGIATIDVNTGVLTPVAVGTVNVTATSVDHPSITDTQAVQITPVVVDPPQVIVGWDFESGNQGWSLNPNNMTASASGGYLNCSPSGNDPYVYNTTSPNFSTTDINYLEIKVKNGTSETSGNIYLWTSTTAPFPIDVPMTANSQDYETITIDLSNTANWSNNLTVTNVRIDPNGAGTSGVISYDYINFMDKISDPTPYNLTVNSGTGDGSYAVSTVVNIDADTAPQGKVFDQWTGDVTNVADVNAASTTISMPGAAATITATYVDEVLYPNALANTGFESPAVSTFQYNPTGGDWTFSGSAGVQKNGSAWGANNAPEGVQTCFLQNGSSSISQTINFPTTDDYSLSFKAARRASQSQTIEVYIDANLIGTFTPTSNGFVSYTIDNIAIVSGVHTVKFQGITSGGDHAAFIDDVSLGLTPVPAPTVLNAGFETPAVATFQYNPSGGDWAFSSGSGVQKNGSAWGATNAPDGVQTGFLQSIASTITQSVNFAASDDYIVRFKAARRASNTQTIEVYIDATLIGTYTPTSNAFVEFTTSAVAVTSGTHTLKFEGAVAGDHTAFIDAVSIEFSPAAKIISGKSNDAHQEEDSEEISLYPNPAKGKLYIKGLHDGVNVSIYATSGQVVLRESYNGYLDISSLRSGIYTLRIEDGSITQKQQLRFVKN